MTQQPFQPYPAPPVCVSSTVIMLLHSPFHALMSHRTMILNVYGKKTGTCYTFPVTYIQEGPTVFCLTRFPWWKNLRDGAAVTLQLRGQPRKGHAELDFDQEHVAQKIAQIVWRDWREAKYFSIQFDIHKQPDPTSLQISAQHFILVRIHLLEKTIDEI